MNSTKKTTAPVPEKINYFALIRAYKVIKSFKQLAPEQRSDELRIRFEEWMNEEKNGIEKAIAESVVMEEMMYNFFFGEEINKALGFELIPDDEHL